MCELLVGLAEVVVLGAEDVAGRPLRVHIESRVDQAWCRECGCRALVKERPLVTFVDLPCFGRPTRLVWHKHRWSCRQRECGAGSWTVIDDRRAPPRAALSDRAAPVGDGTGRPAGRSVNEVAVELACDWHTVNDAVVAYGEALLDANVERIGAIDALGLDETLYFRKGPRHFKQWCTSVVDAGGLGRTGRLIEVVEGRTVVKVSGWLDDQPEDWRAGIRWGVLDMSGPYRKLFTDSLGHVTRSPIGSTSPKHANSNLDECRRRVKNETLGHRGRKDDPLYRPAPHQGPRTSRHGRGGQAGVDARGRRSPRRGAYDLADKRSSDPYTTAMIPTSPASTSPNSSPTWTTT